MQFEIDQRFRDELEDVRTGKLRSGYTYAEAQKLLQAMEVHGWRGPSKKKHNGAVPIPPRDGNLLKTLERLTLLLPPDTRETLRGAAPFKAVAHVKTGYRMVGYRLSSGTLYVVGMANYN
jgi:hypothetical protein